MSEEEAAALIVLAGLLALLVFPAAFHHASFATIWTPHAVAVLGWLVFFSMYFDQLYRGAWWSRPRSFPLRRRPRPVPRWRAGSPTRTHGAPR